MSPSRLLVLTDDRLGARMAGPAIRASEIARALAPAARVTLASLQPVRDFELPGVEVRAVAPRDLAGLARAHDVVFAGGLLFAQHRVLVRSGAAIALDLYAPFLLEDLQRLRGQGAIGRYLYREHHAGLAWQMRHADFMVCASERQRDYWLGRLCALGRLDLEGPRDASARALLDVVPFGIPSCPPVAGERRLRGVLPGVDDRSMVLLWGGGIWDWLDPLTPIRAAARLQEAHPDLKLVFLAGRSPNPGTPEGDRAREARALATELGVLGRSVHFLDTWVPYAERGSLLLEADWGFSAHHEHLETRFSFRTRLLDCLWAGLPFLCTAGDSMAEMARTQGLGIALPEADVEAWMAALTRTVTDGDWRPACAGRVREVADAFTWPRVVEPLARFVARPDRTGPGSRLDWPVLPGWSGLALKAGLSLAGEGPSGLVRRIRRKIGVRGGAS